MGAIVLGDNRYGKAEIRLLRVTRGAAAHDIRDLTVSVALAGDFAPAHLEGDNSAVLPTDSQKNAVYAFAADGPPGEIEDLGLRLARHFLATSPAARRAQVRIDEHAWTRLDAHAFQAGAGGERRQACAIAEGDAAWVAAGLADLLVLKTAGSEFRGFARDRYTTLEETGDRILATAVTARWRYASAEGHDWAAAHGRARQAMLDAFAGRHSRSLQQTLYEMGRAVLEAVPGVAEIRLSLPNRHHFAMGSDDVFHVDDRPYGLIEGTVRREGAPPGPPLDW